MKVLVECDVSAGLRDLEATVKLIAEDGIAEYLPVDRRALIKQDKQYYLPVYIVRLDEAKGRAQIGLPVEADSGAHRVWVKIDTLAEMPEGTRK